MRVNLKLKNKHKVLLPKSLSADYVNIRLTRIFRKVAQASRLWFGQKARKLRGKAFRFIQNKPTDRKQDAYGTIAKNTG